MTGWQIDDPSRLRTIEELGLATDGPADATLDAIVAEAAALCGTPVALVTALDTKHQWFKARAGTDLSGTPADWAICAHTLAHGDTLVIPDLESDPRTRANPLVTEDPHVRFYAGVPLVVEGQAVGTLCVLDTAPRENLSDAQLATLKDLADRATAQLSRDPS